MENEKPRVGRRCRLIVRYPGGQRSSVFTGIITSEDEHCWTIKTQRGEERTEPKMICTVEWL